MAVVENNVDYTDEQGKYYVSAQYLVDLLGLSKASIYSYLKASKVGFIERLVVSRGLKQKFFDYDDIFEKISDFKNKRSKIRALKELPKRHYLRSERPEKLSEGQFRVHCAIILWRNKYDEWPTTSQVVEVLYKHSYTYFYVKDCLLKLQDKGWLTLEHYYKSKNTSRFIIIHDGPKLLITKRMRCAHCDMTTYVFRDYVKPKRG